jgi:hypothetical protein
MPSAQVQITQLPAAGPITGTESVPIVQNGQTVQTTTGAIAASPSQTQTFLTVNQEPTLPNSRALSGGTGVGLTDGGAQSTLQIVLNGASGSLESAGTGVIVKNGASSVVARSLSTTGVGLGITNADGTAGNPTFALTGLAASVANLSGTGMLALTAAGTTISGRELTGTTDQINVADGTGASANPTMQCFLVLRALQSLPVQLLNVRLPLATETCVTTQNWLGLKLTSITLGKLLVAVTAL